MTFEDLYNEIITLRFKSGEVGQVKHWINIREAMIWAAVEWPFKFAIPTTIAFTGGTQTAPLPTGFARMVNDGLRDSDGTPVTYMEPRNFFTVYPPDVITPGSADQGTPIDYTIWNRALYLGPTPSASATYSIIYERTLVHLNGSSTVTAGPMTATDDTPIWDSQFHFILVSAAMSTGLKLQNDPTWQPLEDEFERMLTAMVNHYMPPDRPGNTQYGADTLGNELASWA